MRIEAGVAKMAPAGALAMTLLVAAPARAQWDERPLRKQFEDTAVGVRKSDHDIDRDRRRKPDGLGGFRERRNAFDVHVLPDGRVRFTDRKIKGSPLGFSFDLTDFVMRLHGEDPYRYEKTKYLEQTSEERAVMAVRDRARRIAEATRDLPRLLVSVWYANALPPAQRRKVIFELWDECAEEGPPEVVKAATDARAVILRFVRDHAPPDSPDAIAPGELDGWNAKRKSKAKFDPYEPHGAPAP